jgi:O-antigen/teichoic acid export membrane protein
VKYGLLVLVRLLLPTGALAFFDLGNSEVASYAVARAQHNGDWQACGRLLSGLLRVDLVVGLVAAAFIFMLAPTLVRLFGVGETERDDFLVIINTTAMALPVLLTALAAEGVLRGFEAFRVLRTIDLTTTFIFAGMTYLVVLSGLGFAWVGIAYVVYSLLRAGAVLVCAHRLLRQERFSLFAGPLSEEWRDIRIRCLPLGANRLIGVGQAHASPLLIGALLGPAAVGLFDLIARIPRFLKIVTGVLNTAVLPLVLRLDQMKDRESLRRLFDIGLLGVLCLVAPLIFWCIAFSEAILRLWVSGNFASLWPWQALMLLWPLINVITSFTCGSLLGRPEFVRTLNWVVLGQVSAQIVFSLFAMRFMAERGFVVGQMLALSLSFPFQMALVLRHSDIHIGAFLRHFQLVAGCAVLTVVVIMSGLSAVVNHPLWLAASLIVWVCTVSTTIWLALLRPEERTTISATISSRLRRRGDD